VDFGVHEPTLDNVERGVLERVFLRADGTPPPPCLEGSVSKLEGFSNKLKRLSVRTAKLTEDEFLQYYSGRRLGVYTHAARTLEFAPLTAKDALIKTFVKAEKINMTTKRDPAPRVIQPRSPRFNLELGLYLKHLEPRLYKAVKKTFGEHTIFKGVNALAAGRRLRDKWDGFRNPVAVGLDASRFDQHVRVEMLKFEHNLYKHYFPGDCRLAWLLRQQLRNSCVAYTEDGKIRYVVEGSRMSGDMNTALGNCLIMCALVYTYMAEKGLRYSLANNGDDCVVILEERDLQHFQDGLAAWFWGFGFDMKVEAPVREFEKIDFCQTSPVWTPEGYIMVRNPHNAIDKDNISFENITNEAQWRQACGMIGECGLHLAGHIPMFNAFYRKLFAVGKHSKRIDPTVCGMWWLARGLDYSGNATHPQTRASFALAFGISPDHQEEFEACVGQLSEHYQPNRGGLTDLIDFNLYRDRE